MAPNGDHLHIIDSRTHREYDIPIDDHFIHGSDISAIKSLDKHGEGPERSLGVFDRGLQHIACMESAITHIDGYGGRIEYRGHAIEKLFHENDYDEVLHLLLFGQLPSPQQKKALRSKLAEYLFPPQVVLDVLSQFPRDADPLALVTAGLSAYASADPVAIAARHDPRPQFHGNQAATDDAALRTMAYITATFASIYCHRHGKPLGRPRPDQSLIGNLLLMMGFEVSPAEGSRMLKCMERLWIIYADHEMTNSTAASLCVGSTLTDPISCFMTAVIAGAGPLHAGALELAYSVLNTIGTPENVSQYIEAVKAKQVRLFGYGHRVYKTADPRVSLINELIRDHEQIVSKNPLLRVALAVDEVANTDPYFVERHLKVNADLFGCFLYTAFGFESDLLPGFMMISRAAGVLAHWREAMGQPIKIWRPKQKYKPEHIKASAKL